MTDPVLEATAKASENVFHEKNHESNEILEKFLEKRFENVESIMTGVAEATRILYSSCGEMTGFKSVKMDTNVFEIESFISNSTLKKSPRDSSVESSNLAQLKKSPRNSPALSRPARSLPPAPKKKEKEMRAIYDLTPVTNELVFFYLKNSASKVYFIFVFFHFCFIFRLRTTKRAWPCERERQWSS